MRKLGHKRSAYVLNDMRRNIGARPTISRALGKLLTSASTLWQLLDIRLLDV
jgi:hypothetical protein